MSTLNGYNPNSRLTSLKLELEEAENELMYCSEARKELVQNRIDNIKREIREEE